MSDIRILDGIAGKAMELVERLKERSMRTYGTCPECSGTNLNTSKTKCWDCSGNDYREA